MLKSLFKRKVNMVHVEELEELVNLYELEDERNLTLVEKMRLKTLQDKHDLSGSWYTKQARETLRAMSYLLERDSTDEIL